jgi:uncharacterized membrane protein
MFRRILIAVMILALAFVLYIVTLVPLLAPIVSLPQVSDTAAFVTLFMWLFSICHASYVLGWRQALIFFVLSAVISWLFEQVGVATGMVYGAYHYTETLGIRLGHVPILIPVAWFMMIYPSYVIANLIGTGKPSGVGGSLLRIIWLSALGAMVMTAWDMVMDPFGSSPPGPGWLWEQGGPYFGVPLQNFIGWLLTTFTVYLVYRLIERRMGTQPIVLPTTGVTALALVAYFVIMSEYLIPQSSEWGEALRMVAVFTMGFPLLAATGRLLQKPA